MIRTLLGLFEHDDNGDNFFTACSDGVDGPVLSALRSLVWLIFGDVGMLAAFSHVFDFSFLPYFNSQMQQSY